MAAQDTNSGVPTRDGRFSLGRRFLSLPTLISIVIAILFIAFLWTRFDIDLYSMWRYVRHSQPGWLLLALALYYLTFPLRGWRWRILLDNCDSFREPGSSRPGIPAFSVMILLSWFANSILWFRLGDAYRAYLLGDRHRASFSRSIGTVAAERLMDIGVVFGLLLVAGVGLFLSGEFGGKIKTVILAATVLAGLGGFALLLFRLFGAHVERFLPGRFRSIYGRFQEGTLGSFRRRVPLLVAISVLVWLLETARLYFVMQALGFHAALSLLLLAALAHSMLTTIPLTPGGLGFAELGLTALLAISPSLSEEQAAAATLLDRSITYLSIIVAGGVAFAITQVMEVRRGRVLRKEQEPLKE